MSGSSDADPRIERSRSLITAAAIKEFSVHGYIGASLDDVAKRAGVSKKTIYNVFRDKEQLFRDVAADSIRTAETYASRTAETLLKVPEVEPHLREAIVELAITVLTGQVVPIRRLVIGEIHRFPELAEEYYERAPGLVMRTLARVLARLDSSGELDVPDAHLASEHLAFLVLGPGMDRALFQAPELMDVSVEGVEARAHAAFDAFLAIYLPKRST
ncbi:TetR/AcrR family transcriptional regulator [Nesterenkonia ebinurensis]|uniref:TetR/AcrR family transcriptional regulator n=1 Tax=Nesterenkonia ebinurensis TaxID=2608252 RepID=UPI00123DA32B|nr:TetR/AcrR family transcriptional regulator C-terminal domain-containing protein [Nesterenkonia ebinurensis]